MQRKRELGERLQERVLKNHMHLQSEPENPLGVFILSDVRLCRDGLELIIARRHDIAPIGSACSHIAMGEITARHPDIVLLDASIPDAHGLAREICAMLPDTKIIAFALLELDEEIIACAEAGITAYIGREGSAEDLIDIIYQAARGDFVCSPRLTGLLFRHISTLCTKRCRSDSAAMPDGDDGDIRLTRRERDIIPLIGQGLSNKEIARHLGVGVSTVKNHIHNVLEKLRLRRRVEIIAHFRRGYIDRSSIEMFHPRIDMKR